MQDNDPIPLTTFPESVIPTYVRYISPTRGFGLFAGGDLSVNKMLALNQCVGTYGGVICDDREPICKTAVYKLSYGALPSSDELGYVNSPNQCCVILRPRRPHVDGVGMRGGDGCFANSSCYPNVHLDARLVMYEHPSGPEEGAMMMKYFIARFLPLR